MHDRGAAVLHRVTAGGVTLVWGQRGVRRDQMHGVRRHVQLFRRDLDQRGLDALSQFRLAGKDGDRAVGVDPDPGIEHGGFIEAARERCRPGWRGASVLSFTRLLRQASVFE